MYTPLPPYSSFGFRTSPSRLPRTWGTRSIARPSRVVRPSSDAPRPGNVGGDGGVLFGGEQRLERVVGQHGKDGLLVDGLAAERVHQRDRAVPRGLEEGLQLRDALEELVHEEPLVHDVDLAAVVAQPPALVGEVAGIADQRRVAPGLEEVAEEMVLGPGGHVLVVDDGDQRLRRRAARLAVAGDERRQHRLAGVEALQPVPLLEPLHDRQLQEEVDQHLGVGDPRRALRVQLHELVGVGGDERIQPRGRRAARVSGIDPHQLALLRGDVDAVPEILPQARLRLLDGAEDPAADPADLLVDRPARRGWAAGRGTARARRRSAGPRGRGRGSAPRAPARSAASSSSRRW